MKPDRPWSNDELQFLKANCSLMTDEDMGKRLGRSASSIRHKRQRMGLGPAKRKPPVNAWSEQEDDFVMANYESLEIGEIARRLNRTVASLHHRSQYLGLSKNLREIWWSPGEDRILVENPEMPLKDLEELLPGRTYFGIRSRRMQLGLPRYVERAVWSADEIEIVLNNLYAPMSELVMLVPGKSESSIWVMVRKLGRRRILNRGFTMQSGYRHLYCRGRVGVPEHRIVMERHIGRKLRRGEIVHHINCVRDDNRIENLDLMENSSVHGNAHWTLGKLKKELLAIGAIRYDPRTHSYKIGRIRGTRDGR